MYLNPLRNLNSLRLPLLAAVTCAAMMASPSVWPADIIDTAVADGHFKTLATALKAAGLVDSLKGKGPFTVFAPTDDAFARLPAGTVESLLKPENKNQLAKILRYHVVPGKVMSRDLAGKKAAPVTLEGESLAIDATGTGVKVNDATVTKADVTADNGVIHVIDKVLMPK